MTQPAPTEGIPKATVGLSLGALGVVFGDIGSSPLYTMRECLAHSAEDRAGAVMGILSLMFWTIMLVVNLKYLLCVMRADNRGEGGIFALLALIMRKERRQQYKIPWTTMVVLAGAALLYGDGMITPAITVLSASEGFSSFSPFFEHHHLIVPISVVLLACLFLIQVKGTHTIGFIFGPIMLIWFVVLGALGAMHVFSDPTVLYAVNPMYAIEYLKVHEWQPMALLLGSIVLTITGAEALYADMGHFGRKAISRAWLFVVFPSLVLNYFGQGAYVRLHPTDLGNPFYSLAPEGALRLALITLSIIAAGIASQALISGVFSLTRQAIQLGFFPRVKILHTSAEHAGQIYVPLMNALMAVGAIWIVLEFKTSTALAAAYGIAVTGTMAVTTFALYRVARLIWRWALWKALLLCGLFLAVDLIFLSANLHKFLDGGWLPIVIGICILAIMYTWKAGRNNIQEKVYSGATADLELSAIAKSKSIVRVPGSAVFMVATPKGTPLALLHHLKSNKCLQQTVVLLTISFDEIPNVPREEQLTVEELGEGVWRAIGRFGYMETPDVSRLVDEIKERGVPINPQAATFYFNREMIITGGDARMFEWQKRLYALLSRNATPVKDYYRIMPTQIIEIGLPVQL